MKKVVTVLAVVQLLAVVAQFFLAASGAFDDAPVEESFAQHRVLGNLILLFAVVVTIAAAVARMPGRVTATAAGVAGLVLLQSVIREIAKALGDGSEVGHYVFGLHAVNGLLIMTAVITVLRLSLQASKTVAPEHVPA